MKKKGFTLIELLAVIVILALVALITIPVITGIINSVRKKAFEDTVHGLVESANIYYTSHLKEISGTETYIFDFDNNNGKTEEGEELLFKGDRPIGGKIVLHGNGQVSVENITNGRYYASKLLGSNEIAISTTNTTLTADELTAKMVELEKMVKDPIYSFKNSHPVGSIYITVSEDENSVEAMENKYKGTSWELYGPGRTLVNMGSNGTTNYTTVNTTGGSSSASLVATNIPTLSVTGTTDSTGSGYTIGYGAEWRGTSEGGTHAHAIDYVLVYGVYDQKGNYTPGATNWAANNSNMGINQINTASSGNHTHASLDYYVTSISGVAAHTHPFTGTYTNNAQTSVSTQNPYITVYMYKRTA